MSIYFASNISRYNFKDSQKYSAVWELVEDLNFGLLNIFSSKPLIK